MLCHNTDMENTAHSKGEGPIERLRLAFELFEAGERMMRLNIRRRHPDLDDAAVEKKLIQWLQQE